MSPADLTGMPYFIVFTITMIVLYSIAFYLGIRLKKYFSRTRIDRSFSKKGGLVGNIIAALFGAITPFCSCTTIPIFAGMLKSDIPLGHAMSFLIASPTINPPAIILLVILFGWSITAYYILAVFAVAIIGGRILGHRNLKNYVYDLPLISDDLGDIGFQQIMRGYLSFLRRFIFFILAAATLATLLKTWAPSEQFVWQFLNKGYVAVPVGVGIGAVIYADLLLLLPIASSLIQKGIPYGTVFAFTMAASGIGLPSLLLLSRIIHRKLIIYYVLTLCCLLIILGYLFNFTMRR